MPTSSFSQAETSTLSHLDSERAWRPLHYLNLYRITLAALFVSAVFVKGNLPVLGSANPSLFQTISFVYLGVALAASFAIRLRWTEFRVLTYGLMVIDILSLTLIMRASGGIETGLGMLLIVAIAGNSLLLSSRAANLFAAIAAIAVLGEQVLAHQDPALTSNFTQAGILGASLFATAFLAHVLSSRIRESEALAAQRGVDLANLAQLNQHVLQRMQSGIVVVDADLRVRLMNESAWYMLGLPSMGSTSSKSLKLISPELAEQLIDWRRGGLSEARMFRPGGGSVELLPNMTALGSEARAGTLIFLEDTARMAQQAQQMKLASLGRLTASIAHEIRNPLGAISHAEQLLTETASDNPSEKRLLEIIHTNSRRVNDIIENVLQLSRRDHSMPETIALKPWLEDFVNEFVHSQKCDPADIRLHVEPADITAHMDATQLHQVLWNLCHNGLRHSQGFPRQPKLELHCGQSTKSHAPFIDVIDQGPGIPPDVAPNIFEPFFTTESKGSGLGLYIARELCESNQARLNYVAIPTGGACFRLEFANAPVSAKSTTESISRVKNP
ncbi:MAG: ATP-binding protein [Gammaproteobacteria bacterium]|nr:ATP-binding protein [Gammaproteobacteria bacterium]